MTVPDEPSWSEIWKAAARWGGRAGAAVSGFILMVGVAGRRSAQAAERERTTYRWTDKNRWER